MVVRKPERPCKDGITMKSLFDDFVFEPCKWMKMLDFGAVTGKSVR
jgi:hypothetical protein